MFLGVHRSGFPPHVFHCFSGSGGQIGQLRGNDHLTVAVHGPSGGARPRRGPDPVFLWRGWEAQITVFLGTGGSAWSVWLATVTIEMIRARGLH